MTGGYGTSRLKRKRNAQSAAPKVLSEHSSRALYLCNYCSRDISSGVRIRCAGYDNFDLCLMCFSTGCEIYPYKRGQPYQVVDRLSFPLYDVDWAADEELLLVEAIDNNGLGNWQAICEHVGTKTEQECQRHYFATYIDHPGMPQPAVSPLIQQVDIKSLLAAVKKDGENVVGRTPQEVELLNRMRIRQGLHKTPAEQSGMSGYLVAEEGCIDQERSISRSITRRQDEADTLSPPPQSKGNKVGSKGDNDIQAAAPTALAATSSMPRDQAATKPPTASSPEPGVATPNDANVHNQSELTGYNQKRHEFDPEYDNDAESLIAEIEFRQEDTEEDVQQKLRMMSIYYRRLRDREILRDQVRDKGLLHVKKQQAADKRKSVTERQIAARARVFNRFIDMDDAAKWVDGISTEMKLRQRVQQLKELRRAGCRTFHDAELQSERKQTLPHSTSLLQSHVAPLSPPQTPFLTPTGAGTPQPLPDYDIDSPRAVRDLGSQAETQNFNTLNSAQLSASTPAASVTGGTKSVTGTLTHPTQSNAKATASSLAMWRQKRGLQLDVTCFPGVELLTQQEIELCSQQRIVPAHYLVLKHTLMKEYMVKGKISRQEARNYFRLDAAKSQKVFELLQAAKWINHAEDDR